MRDSDSTRRRLPQYMYCACGRRKRKDRVVCLVCVEGSTLKIEGKKKVSGTKGPFEKRRMSGFALLFDPAVRTCVQCGRVFKSASKENRRCPKCKFGTKDFYLLDGYTFPESV